MFLRGVILQKKSEPTKLFDRRVTMVLVQVNANTKNAVSGANAKEERKTFDNQGKPEHL